MLQHCNTATLQHYNTATTGAQMLKQLSCLAAARNSPHSLSPHLSPVSPHSSPVKCQTEDDHLLCQSNSSFLSLRICNRKKACFFKTFSPYSPPVMCQTW